MLAAKIGYFRATAHPEALAWQTRVISNGGTVAAATLTAVSNFCTAIDAAGIRDRFLRLNLLCGSGLAAALVPLYRGQSRTGTQVGNTIDTNNNFVSGDYVETGSAGGLKGNGSTKFLWTGITPSIAAVPTITFSAYADSMETTGSSINYVLLGMLRSNLGFRGAALNAYWNFSSGQRRFDIVGNSVSAAPNQPTPLPSAAFVSGGHVSGTTYAVFSNGIQINSASATITTPTGVENSQYSVFARNTPGTDGDTTNVFTFTSARIKAYHIGTSMTAAQQLSFYNAMQAFQAALGRNV